MMIVSLLNYRINEIISGENHNICIGSTREIKPNKNDDNKPKETIVFSWGSNEYGQLAQEGEEYSENPKVIEWFNEKIVKKVDCGMNHSLFLLGKFLFRYQYTNTIFLTLKLIIYSS